jgi:FdhD protein
MRVVPPELTDVDVVRVRDRTGRRDRDCVAVEAPLEIRLGGVPFAVVMRTPGADRELAAGFLFAERVLKTQDDLGTIAWCTDLRATNPENVVNVTLTGASAASLDAALGSRRQVIANASCGVCGRVSIESLRVDCPRIDAPVRVPSDVVLSLPAALRGRQAVFTQTGGLHAAGLFAPDGELLDAAEDVGRHNAVDKIIGRMILREALPASSVVLFVSGRTSFEIVQKAWLAGISCVASVSAPSSLAVELAASAGMTLIGFVREGGFNVYAGGDEHRPTAGAASRRPEH